MKREAVTGLHTDRKANSSRQAAPASSPTPSSGFSFLLRLRFYLLRLKRASLSELFHRLEEQIFLPRLKSNPFLYRKDILSNLLKKSSVQTLHFPVLHGAAADETLSRLLGGKVFTLHHDPPALKEFEEKWRGVFFATVRQNATDPDIRAVWEPARLQHLMLLLHHIHTECDEEDSREIKVFIHESLLGWLYTNPFPCGPHYISAMECGLRIPVFIRALQLLDNLTSTERKTILTAIYQHGWIISKRLSLHSSLGNHTVTECVGLIMAGAVFQDDLLAGKWLQTGIILLEQECRHQILADGGPAEQSLNYHRFVLDLYWLAISFLEENALHNCHAMRVRTQTGEKFLAAFQTQSGLMPAIGDSDDGYAVAPTLAPERSANRGTIHTISHFPDTGYTVIRGLNDTLLTFDHGPLGMPPLYNHGHADALSITLFHEGQPIFIDPGTFQYNGSKEKRRYFKSTRAHNTVSIDERDQAEQLTGFIWDHPYAVRWDRQETAGVTILSGTHDGYVRLQNHVRHTRKIVGSVSDGIFVIKDTFTGVGDHRYDLHFHLHPDVVCADDGERLLLTHCGTTIRVRLIGDSFQKIRGQDNPLLGWYAPAYGLMQETTVLRCRKEGKPEEISFTTFVFLGMKSNQETVEKITRHL